MLVLFSLQVILLNIGAGTREHSKMMQNIDSRRTGTYRVTKIHR